MDKSRKYQIALPPKNAVMGGGLKGELLSFITPNPFGIEGRLRWRLKDNKEHIIKPQKKFDLDHLEAVEAASKMS